MILPERVATNANAHRIAFGVGDRVLQDFLLCQPHEPTDITRSDTAIDRLARGGVIEVRRVDENAVKDDRLPFLFVEDVNASVESDVLLRWPVRGVFRADAHCEVASLVVGKRIGMERIPLFNLEAEPLVLFVDEIAGSIPVPNRFVHGSNKVTSARHLRKHPSDTTGEFDSLFVGLILAYNTPLKARKRDLQ